MNTLYIYIDSQNNELKNHYIESIGKHNSQIKTEYPDSGFDLFNPDEILIKNNDFSNITQIKLDSKMKCAMFDTNNKPCGFYLYARSSISKTNVRLANSVGIIDSGYRGNIIGMFDIINPKDCNISMEKFTRLLQICSGDLKPFKVIIMDSPECLGTTTRGEGGFGSTGK